ncbi:hypothetical protein SASPL_107686 [Salvia splendens]|uniref:Uncharacterized protein n=1 Tax=Salvia splendens TaxID=180675 RepID=A0A8X8YDD5_SALSN|nr:hypothetical protein SASPL_107686 [Salvia splendens]
MKGYKLQIVGGSREGPGSLDVASGPVVCGADAVATANPASPVVAVAAIAKHLVEELAVSMVVAAADIVGAVVQHADAETWVHGCCAELKPLQSGLKLSELSKNVLHGFWVQLQAVGYLRYLRP